ncbi:MAG: Peptide chain release factor 2 [Phycisphaerae bacterium]|nr:Peptide chain release factor 2 [Phycisphaerae bacterium]
MSAPGFWNNSETSQKVIAEVKQTKAIVEPLEAMLKKCEDIRTLLELLEQEADPALAGELERELHALEQAISQTELITLYSGPHDAGNCYFSIQAGTGGADACDWAEMMFRMYLRYCERVGYQVTELDRNMGDVAGIQSVDLYITGPYAYGNLTCEAGVHRMERVSPFNAQGKRQTSFAAVAVTPELADIEVEVEWDKEVREDTYRAGGKGGQHVNKTDSAVRLTHLASGIVTQCQNERSQHQNRAMARSMMMSRLYQLEQAKRDSEIAKLIGDKGQIGFGYRIRSYTLHSYNQISDERTRLKLSNVEEILDGDLQELIEAELRRRANKALAK